MASTRGCRTGRARIAAVGADVPERLRVSGRTYAVSLGEVTRVD